MTFGGLALGDVADAGVGDCGLAIEHQANRLNRLDRQRLMSFDQRAVVREVVNTDCITGVEGPPESSEDLESHSGAAIARCSHHARYPFMACGASATRLPHIRYIFPRETLYLRRNRFQ